MDARLFDAAFRGDVNALQELIAEDPLILHTVTVTTSNHTIARRCPSWSYAVCHESLTALDLAVRSTTGSNDEDEIQEIIRSVGAELTDRVERLEQSIASNQQRSSVARREKFVGSLKNGIGILAAIFASLSFQVGMNPPGGVWQEWGSSNATKSAADGNTDTDPNSWSESLFLGLFELASVSHGRLLGPINVSGKGFRDFATTKGGKEKDRIESEKQR
ncbi:hypothetical protein OIU79_003055 [Salix purpurea]|uniref:Uncharacterized protein n=1 Tax=Salix purpurea TaxID=77065 RepID=A0A9Q0ZEW3_SALPP|nr:hypothetical protein OIU79_003055 [Salix purpurea]